MTAGVRRAAVGVAAALVVVLAGALPASAATSDPTSEATPTATPTSTPDATPAATPEAAATPEVTATPTAAPGGDDAGIEVGGVLFVSGVRTGYAPSKNPLGGTLHLEMTVRNAADQVVDASVSYGATTLLGFDLGGANSLAVRDMAPGEVRVVKAEIDGIGQWALVKAHMTLRPPAEFRGVELPPLYRERWVLAPPWYLIGLVVLVVGVPWLVRRVRLPKLRRRRRSARARPVAGQRSALPGAPQVVVAP